MWSKNSSVTPVMGRASYYVTPRQRQEGEQTVDEVYAEAWTGPICYEQCTPERTAAFPVTEEGLAQLRTWLEDNLAQIDQAARPAVAQEPVAQSWNKKRAHHNASIVGILEYSIPYQGTKRNRSALTLNMDTAPFDVYCGPAG